MTKKIVETFQRELDQISDLKAKRWWENYVKNTMFRGVSMGKIRSLMKNLYLDLDLKKLEPELQLDICIDLMSSAYSEDKLMAILFLQNYVLNNLDHQILLKSFESLYAKKYIFDWNICDWFCIKVLAALVKENTEAAEIIFTWAENDYVWQARSSLVAFIPHMKVGSYDDKLLKISHDLVRRPDRFAKTAVAWTLREIAKRDKEIVFNFIKKQAIFLTPENYQSLSRYFSSAEKKKVAIIRQSLVK